MEKQGFVKGFGCLFVSDALTSSIRPGDFYLTQSDSKSIKTQGGQGCIICLVLRWMVLLWRLWLWWWMFHDPISGEWDTDHAASGWKENCSGFPGCLPWAICCKALTSAAVSYRTALCLKKWLLWQGYSFYQKCVLYSQTLLLSPRIITQVLIKKC